jgi:hypothetical protein
MSKLCFLRFQKKCPDFFGVTRRFERGVNFGFQPIQKTVICSLFNIFFEDVGFSKPLSLG